MLKDGNQRCIRGRDFAMSPSHRVKLPHLIEYIIFKTEILSLMTMESQKKFHSSAKII